MAKLRVRFDRFFSSRKLLAALVVWYMAMWAWVPFSKSTEMAGGKFTGWLMVLVVLLVNVSLSVFITWKTFKLINQLYSKNSNLSYFLAPFIFSVTDFLVSWLVALVWLGPQGSWDSTLPLASPTLVLINTWFGFASRFIGFYGIAGIAWTVVWLATKKQYKIIGIVLLTTLTIAAAGRLVYSNKIQSIPIKTTIISELKNSKVDAIKDSNDLVIFPEYGLTQIENDNLAARIATRGGSGYFVGSEISYTPNVKGQQNNLVYGSSEQGIIGKFQKRRLIPGGEDLPYVLRGLLNVTNQKSNLSYFDNIRSVNKGVKPVPVINLGGIKLGAGLCSSIVAPQDYRKLTGSGAEILSNSASLGVFSQSNLFNWQQKSLATFISTANARYFLQSANDANAYALNQNGQQIAQVNSVNQVSFFAYTNKKKTFYTLAGEWTAWVGGIILILSICLTSRFKVHQIKNPVC